MAVAALEIARRQPYPYDYERIDGILHFAVDPAHRANARIVDLDRAARDDNGRVRFWADVTILQPRDAARANRRLLYYVVNRGRRPVVPLNRGPAADQLAPPDDEIHPGDGFLMRHGWTVAMCGWQWDVERRPGMMGLEAPQALANGQPIQGQVAIQFQPNERHPDEHLAHYPLHPRPGLLPIQHRPYPAADLHDPTATLTVRDGPNGPRTTIARERWRFAREDGGRPVPDDTRVWLDGGFEAGRIYEVVYRTRICPVVGAGLLATRDCTSFLRYADAASGNPSAGRIDWAYGFGISQCGRFLRQFLYDAVNLDEAGRPAFDGLIPHVAGARRGEFNQRYAQPSAQHAPGFGHMMPFASDDQTDPLTGQSDGLLRRQRALGGVPKVFTTNTSSEYWRIDCSLIHTDLAGTRDVDPPAEERIYMVAGHRHGPGAIPATAETPVGARGANEFTVVDGSPLFRAFLVNLDRWVSQGVEPPPSAFPRLSDGTAVPRSTVIAFFANLPGVAIPDVKVLPRVQRVDLGPNAGDGIGRFPATLGEPYPSFVSAVDSDGNEIAGIRLPDLIEPIGAHTGWVPRHPSTGGAGELVDMQGTTAPLSATPAERARTGDPRPSIGERYRDRADYVARARRAAERLVAERHLLAEDLDLAVELAVQRYDAYAPKAVGV